METSQTESLHGVFSVKLHDNEHVTIPQPLPLQVHQPRKESDTSLEENLLEEEKKKVRFATKLGH